MSRRGRSRYILSPDKHKLHKPRGKGIKFGYLKGSSKPWEHTSKVKRYWVDPETLR